MEVVGKWNNKTKIIKFLRERGAKRSSQEFFSAAARGDDALLKQILKKDKKKRNLRTLDQNYWLWSPLHFAVSQGHEDAVALLCKKGAYLDITDAHGNTPLHHAVRGGDFDMIDLLIEKGADIYALNDNKESVLHIAAMKGNLELVKEFYDKGLSLKKRTEDQNTALHYAAKNGHTDVVEYLLKKKSTYKHASNSNKRTPLDEALLEGHAVASQSLIGAGAFANVFDGKERKQLDKLDDTDSSSSSSSSSGSSSGSSKRTRSTDFTSPKKRKRIRSKKGVLDFWHKQQRAEEEKKWLKDDSALFEYYTTLRSELSRVFIGAQTLETGMFKIKVNRKATAAKLLVEGVGMAIPFSSVLTKLVGAGIDKKCENTLKKKFRRILRLAPDSTEFNDVVEEVARQIAVGNSENIHDIDSNDEESKRARNRVAKWKKIVKGMKEIIEDNELDTPVKKEAALTVGILLDAIFESKIKETRDIAKQLVAVIMGGRFKYRSPVTESDSSVSSTTSSDSSSCGSSSSSTS